MHEHTYTHTKRQAHTHTHTHTHTNTLPPASVHYLTLSYSIIVHQV